MNSLPKDLLEAIGIDLNGTAYDAFVEHFDETLSNRIIDEIIDNLDEQQIEQCSQMKNTDSDQLWQWVAKNVPDLKNIIQDEVDILLGELAENADSI